MSNSYKYLSAITLTLLVFGAVSTSSYAQGRSDAPGRPDFEAKQLRSTPPKARIRLDEAKLKACKVKEKVIQTRTDSLVDMANNMLEKFDSILARVMAYYETTDKSVTTYDSLVEITSTKRTAVTTALSTAQGSATGFSCTVDDPRGKLSEYQTSMKTVRSALGEYRTSIKNVIVAVRSTAVKMEKEQNREEFKSPRPVRTPNPAQIRKGNQNK